MVLTFQQIILTLQQYWGKQGCALLQPYDMEVGAGTSHTATFLRALGPEPWKAAMYSQAAAQKMAVMAKTQTVCSIIINIKWC